MNTQNDKQENQSKDLKQKRAFQVLYFGQKVLRWDDSPERNNHIIGVGSLSDLWVWGTYLELIPLSEISDEHAIEVANIMDVDPNLLTRDEFHIRFGKDGDSIGIWFDGEILVDGEQCPLYILQVYDYLRSQSYLLPFRSYSTQQLIDMGWVKLKNK